MLNLVNSLDRGTKQTVVLCIDVGLVPVALILAFALQMNGFPPFDSGTLDWLALPLLMLMAGLLSMAMGIHKIQLKSYESRAISLSAAHAVIMGMATATLDDLANFGTPLATFINFAIVYFLMAVGLRLGLLQVLLAVYRRGKDQYRVLIYGAGRTGRQLAAALRTDDTIMPVAFVDDSRALQSTIVQGLSVYSPIALQTLVRERRVDRVLLAMPSVPRPRLAEISARIEALGVEVQALPSFAQLTGNQPLLQQLQPVVPGRFLGRAPLDSELEGGDETYAGRCILITGAGGTIGSELCRQLMGMLPQRLILLEISELALYTLELELRVLAEKTGVEIVPVLGSVGDAGLLRRVMARYQVQVVLHAAAYKHVPLVESNPAAGLTNNVLGTQIVAQVAGDMGVRRFMLISSDKAVRPTNVMGASKRMAEIVVQDLASRSNATGGGTIYAMVRFGNVIGSSGSVIPLFADQIARGGPVTLTHRDVTRYFMTIPEAARLVLVAGGYANGGDVFVLDMGDPVPILDLARQMIEAAGYRVRDESTPEGDIDIVLTGLRPGEKLHEELLIGQGQITTPHPKILQAREAHLSQIEVAAGLKALRAAVVDADERTLRSVIARWVEVDDTFGVVADVGTPPLA